MSSLVIGCLLLAAAPALAADDVSSTMAALKDEKAQCRYLLQLCSEFAIDQRIASESFATAQSAVAAAKTKREAQPAMARMEAAMVTMRRSLQKVTDGRTVMKAMHEKMPNCVNECVDDKGVKVLGPW